MSTDCVFCERIDTYQYEQTPYPEVVRFAPLKPVTVGHMLFVSRRHVEHAGYLPWVAGDCAEAASDYGMSLVGQVLHQNVKPVTGFNLITSAGRHATQTVMHLHVHVLPRYRDDGLVLPWTHQQREETTVALRG